MDWCFRGPPNVATACARVARAANISDVRAIDVERVVHAFEPTQDTGVIGRRVEHVGAVAHVSVRIRTIVFGDLAVDENSLSAQVADCEAIGEFARTECVSRRRRWAEQPVRWRRGGLIPAYRRSR